MKKKKIQGDCFVKTWIITDQPNVLSSRTSISSVIYIYIDTHTLLHLLLVEIIESQICPNHLDLLFSCDFSTKVIRNERRRCLQADPADGQIHPPRSGRKGQRDPSFCWRSTSFFFFIVSFLLNRLVGFFFLRLVLIWLIKLCFWRNSI